MSKKFIKSERRNFLKGAVVAGSAAAIAPNVTAAPEVKEPLKVQDKGDKGYEENDYIRNYYDRARFFNGSVSAGDSSAGLGLFGRAVNRRTFLRHSGVTAGGAALATVAAPAMVSKVRAAELCQRCFGT